MKPLRPSFWQRGAVAVLVALLMVFIIIGFVGIVLDLGRLFINKTELQNAVDACALAAAREMNAPDKGKKFLERAENAGIFVGNKHLHDFQLTPVDLVRSPPDVTFSEDLNGVYRGRGEASDSVRYVRCTKRIAGFAQWFPQLLWQGGSTAISPVGATAVAWMGGSSYTCAIPLAMCKGANAECQVTQPDGTKTPEPPFNLCRGQWYGGELGNDGQVTGVFNWVDVASRGGGSNDLEEFLAGRGICEWDQDAKVMLAKPGSNQNLRSAWNSRFGLYKKEEDGKFNVSNAVPDWTGWAFGPTNWPLQQSAYAEYRKGQAALQPQYQGQDATGLKIGNYKPSTPEEHSHGLSDRRLVVMPVTECNSEGKIDKSEVPVLGWACTLMVNPMNQTGQQPLTLEYLGEAGARDVPCATYGLGGGSGPPVPTLVK